MAQAPDQEEGAPRKTTTRNKFEGMASQNERYNVKENEMFWLENIMRTGPRKLSSVPGPSFRRYFPDTLPTLCTDATERGQQHLKVVTAFQQRVANDRTSWAYVSPTGEVTTLFGNVSCGSGNMYYDICCSLNHFIDNIPIVNDHPALIDPTHNPAINAWIGVGDQPAYAFIEDSLGAGLGNGMRVFYPNSNSHADYIRPPVGSGWLGYVIRSYCFKGDELWIRANENSVKRPIGFVQYTRSTGAILANYTSLTTDLVSNMNLTGSNLVCLTRDATVSTSRAIKKISRSDGSLVETIDLSDLNCTYLFAVNENLIYILCGANAPTIPAKMYYWNGSDVIFVGLIEDFPATPFTQGAGQFSGGRYYFGTNGFGGFTVDIFSLAVACPSGSPLVASVTRDSATVAAGGSIGVSWADILEPNPFAPGTFDRIVLYPKPRASKLDFFTSTAVAEQITDGSSAGSMSFAIPGGTLPGDYVFRYQMGATAKNVLVATSNSFTVT